MKRAETGDFTAEMSQEFHIVLVQKAESFILCHCNFYPIKYFLFSCCKSGKIRRAFRQFPYAIPVQGIFQAVIKEGELIPEPFDFSRSHQSQLPAFKRRFRKARHITEHTNPQLLCFPADIRIEHRGKLVKDHSFDPGPALAFQESPEHGQHGTAHPSCIYGEYDRRFRQGRDFTRTAVFGKPHAVIISHYPFNNMDVRLPSGKQSPERLVIGKKTVQITGFYPKHPAVEHRINIIRPAFIGGRTVSLSDKAV